MKIMLVLMKFQDEMYILLESGLLIVCFAIITYPLHEIFHPTHTVYTC